VLKRKPDEAELLQRILDQLELLVNLVAVQIATDKSVTEAARALKMAGLDNRTIAEVPLLCPGSACLLSHMRRKVPFLQLREPVPWARHNLAQSGRIG
jgi:hypothetical protein